MGQLIRYADDFCVLHPTLAGVNKAREIVEEWLKGIGLALSPKKTKITHTLNVHEGSVGFDFLGHTVRKYEDKLLITPAKGKVQILRDKIRQVIQSALALSQEELIRQLNPRLRGWANYYRNAAAKATFATCAAPD